MHGNQTARPWKHDADMVVMGSRGMAGGTENIFFGSTTERVAAFYQTPGVVRASG